MSYELGGPLVGGLRPTACRIVQILDSALHCKFSKCVSADGINEFIIHPITKFLG